MTWCTAPLRILAIGLVLLLLGLTPESTMAADSSATATPWASRGRSFNAQWPLASGKDKITGTLGEFRDPDPTDPSKRHLHYGIDIDGEDGVDVVYSAEHGVVYKKIRLIDPEKMSARITPRGR